MESSSERRAPARCESGLTTVNELVGRDRWRQSIKCEACGEIARVFTRGRVASVEANRALARRGDEHRRACPGTKNNAEASRQNEAWGLTAGRC